jgi:hypothetical protein
MSMKSYANHGWIIPKEVLKKELPEVMEYLENEEEDFERWMQDDYEGEDAEKSERFMECRNKIVSWGRSKGLELVLDYTVMDEDNENPERWMVFCENAYTINPAFKEIGGEEILWTTYG